MQVGQLANMRGSASLGVEPIVDVNYPRSMIVNGLANEIAFCCLLFRIFGRHCSISFLKEVVDNLCLFWISMLDVCWVCGGGVAATAFSAPPINSVLQATVSRITVNHESFTIIKTVPCTVRSSSLLLQRIPW